MLSFLVLRPAFFVSGFAHELERTRVSLRFVADGAFTLDVSNDPEWLLLRLEPFAGHVTPTYRDPQQRDRRLAELAPVFIDRIVLFVDGREVRPESAEYVPPGVYRLHGRMPAGARSLRWFYGIVIDPYPLDVESADGSKTRVWVAGEAWSGPIDLTGRFHARTRWQMTIAPLAAVAGLGLLAWYRRRERLRP